MVSHTIKAWLLMATSNFLKNSNFFSKDKLTRRGLFLGDFSVEDGDLTIHPRLDYWIVGLLETWWLTKSYWQNKSKTKARTYLSRRRPQQEHQEKRPHPQHYRQNVGSSIRKSFYAKTHSRRLNAKAGRNPIDNPQLTSTATVAPQFRCWSSWANK